MKIFTYLEGLGRMEGKKKRELLTANHRVCSLGDGIPNIACEYTAGLWKDRLSMHIWMRTAVLEQTLHADLETPG